MRTAKAKITKGVVDGAFPSKKGEARIWDTDVKGFVLRIYPTRRKVYAIVGRGCSRFTRLASMAPWTPDEARKAALEALRCIVRGRARIPTERKAASAALAVSDLIDHYLTDGPAMKPAKRLSGWVSDGPKLNRNIRPLIGTKAVDHVTKGETSRAIRDIMDGKTVADVRTGPS